MPDYWFKEERNQPEETYSCRGSNYNSRGAWPCMFMNLESHKILVYPSRRYPFPWAGYYEPLGITTATERNWWTEPVGTNPCSTLFSRLNERFYYSNETGVALFWSSPSTWHLVYHIVAVPEILTEWKSKHLWCIKQMFHYFHLIGVTILFLSKTNSSYTRIQSYRKGPSARKLRIHIIVIKLSISDFFYLKD